MPPPSKVAAYVYAFHCHISHTGATSERQVLIPAHVMNFWSTARPLMALFRHSPLTNVPPPYPPPPLPSQSKAQATRNVNDVSLAIVHGWRHLNGPLVCGPPTKAVFLTVTCSQHFPLHKGNSLSSRSLLNEPEGEIWWGNERKIESVCVREMEIEWQRGRRDWGQRNWTMTELFVVLWTELHWHILPAITSRAR